MSALDVTFEPGSHIGHLYKGSEERKQLILPFFREGLRNGEHCLLLSSPETFDEWFLEFQAYGIDVRNELDKGALKAISGAEWRGHGIFNSVIQARETLEMLQDLLASFKGVRIAGDANWDLEPAVSPEDLCHWEATANLVFEREPVRAICEYNLSRYSCAVIHSVLRTHSTIIYQGQVFRTNPTYEASRILENEPYLNSSQGDARTIEEALNRLSI